MPGPVRPASVLDPFRLVPGHGAAVAKVATSLRDLMRRYINYVDQSRLVRGLNDEFSRLAEMGSEGGGSESRLHARSHVEKCAQPRTRFEEASQAVAEKRMLRGDDDAYLVGGNLHAGARK